MNNGIKASVSGIRGVLGESLTPPVVLGYVNAYAGWLGKGTVAVGRDTRSHGTAIQEFVESVLMACGINVVDLGIVPTPTLLHYVRENGLDGGILVTASHNPIEWNALKLVKKGGLFLNQADFESLSKLFSDTVPKGLYKPAAGIGNKQVDDAAPVGHIEAFVLKCNIQNVRLRKFKVAIDPGNGAGARMDREFLVRMGCSVQMVHGEMTGGFERPPEPRPDALGDLCKLVVREHCQIGFAQDPDADRLCVVDETGTPLSEEMTLALSVWSWLMPKSRKEQAERADQAKAPVVANISTSRMVADVARYYGHPFVTAKVGEANVLQTMKECAASIGGEGNGGVILPAINACRDSFVGMFLIMDLVTVMREPLSKVVEYFHEKIAPRYAMLKDKTSFSGDLATGLKRFRDACTKTGKSFEVTDIDGVRIDFEDGWVHLRESNTEPIVRVIAEAGTEARARQLVALARGALE
ncbi:MAG TPA: phosphoglucosamine mutase [Spirochaetota bacterium]|nr:phosphoglucosamine mutase [Spirochaetota bacterium]